MVDWAICVICSFVKIINVYPIFIDSWHLGALKTYPKRGSELCPMTLTANITFSRKFILTLPTATWNGRTLAPDHHFLLV